MTIHPLVFSQVNTPAFGFHVLQLFLQLKNEMTELVEAIANDNLRLRSELATLNAHLQGRAQVVPEAQASRLMRVQLTLFREFFETIEQDINDLKVEFDALQSKGFWDAREIRRLDAANKELTRKLAALEKKE